MDKIEVSKEIHCPYCDTKFWIKEKDVFVIFDRIGLCFVNCKECGQTIGVDKELTSHPDELLLLSEEDCSVALTNLQYHAQCGEDIRWDKVSEIIAKAQLAQCQPIIEARGFKAGVKATMDWAVKHHYVTSYDLDKFIVALKGDKK